MTYFCKMKILGRQILLKTPTRALLFLPPSCYLEQNPSRNIPPLKGLCDHQILFQTWWDRYVSFSLTVFGQEGIKLQLRNLSILSYVSCRYNSCVRIQSSFFSILTNPKIVSNHFYHIKILCKLLKHNCPSHPKLTNLELYIFFFLLNFKH